MKRKRNLTYIVSILFALAMGGIGGLLTRSGMEAFEMVRQPSFAPPDIVFPIVWSVLFILMGISAARIWLGEDENRDNAIIIYVVQLVINVLWNLFFFVMQVFALSFWWIVLLWVAILVMIVVFSRIDRTAGLIQIPYLLWVTFASYLTYSIWMLNT